MLVLVLGFAAVEALGGWYSGSLALLADAGHMVTDASALGIALLAVWLAGRAVTARHTYGYRRAEFLAAFVNALSLVALAGWIVVEALTRMETPAPVLGGPMLLVALVGLGVNLLSWRVLSRPSKMDLNLRAALWHVLGDLLGSLGAIGAALVIQFTGWTPVDALVSLGIAGLIGVGGARIVYDSATLLLDRAPGHLDSGEIGRFLAGYPSVQQVCDLHVWSISSQETMLTAHLVVGQGIDRDRFLGGLLSALRDRFHLAHMTVQLENTPHDTCPPGW
ncbi:MAG: cation diffusion facilitator family transporter [Deltaproteobacteria bacterium]|nr:cation diffusion facilitator family transporter [Deltaproteobacteria bacterium]